MSGPGGGGLGVVSAAEMLCHAAVEEGKYAQAFPSFGPERRGAPVVAFNRFDGKPIWVRGEIGEPDVVVVLDPALLASQNVAEGFKRGGIAVINTRKGFEHVKGFFQNAKLAIVDADKIALEVLGVPIVNSAMMGAFVRATGLVSLGSILEVIRERFKGDLGEKNARVASMAYEETKLSG